ncbi:MAG TPA: filamentous hemagglutinin N-terminal domain-containing protein [Steroidobacteraceae bacterium]|nr:filamentous hemagglutinin N-terminal domain-containing protein [Steroidobacteraceae bacterium]
MTRKNRSNPPVMPRKKALAILIGAACGVSAGPNVYAGPQGGVVTAGQGAISTPTSTSTVIDQSSNRVSIDWQSFDVGSNESVTFRQPSSNSVALNRILDQKPSEIFGRLDANGHVVLVNSNGMLFGPGSQVNVGSLVATSLNVVSFDAVTGQLRLSAAGTPGAIVNQGSLNAARGGSVSLVGGAVANDGLIVADVGAVNLAAGRAATIDLYGGGLLRFDADSELLSGSGTGVSNAGQIHADGGQVLLTTSAAQNVFDRAINNDGLVRANRIENVGGAIRLVGAGGTVINEGVLDASGVGGDGGSVQVLGRNVGLFGSSVVDVSGDADGGVALIGGDYQGKNPDVLNANRVIVNPDARVFADAGTAGDGGRVILWSDDATQFYGGILVRGGAQSGDGGFVEVSSHGVLDFDGLVNLGANAGAGGRLLLDPRNITIDTSGGGAANQNFADTPNADVNVDRDSIQTALQTGSVELQAHTDIDVNADITGTGANRGLTLRAGDDIRIASGVVITTNNGAIRLFANDSGATPVGNDATGDVVFADDTARLVAGSGAITISSEGDLALSAISGGAITVESTAGNISRIGTTRVSGSSVTATAFNDLTIFTTISGNGNVDATASNGGTGALTLNNNSPGMTVVNAVGDGVTVIGGNNGNVTLGAINAGGGAASISATGSILDDDNDSTSIVGSSVSLTSNHNIGTITNANLRAGTGSSVDISTGGNVSAQSADEAAQINLNFVIPTPANISVELGTDNGTGSSGTLLLQSASSFNVNSAIGAGDIVLNNGNTAHVGFRSGGTLTLPVSTTGLFDDAPDTLVLHGGTDIVDSNGGAITLAANNLVFDSDGTASLDIDVDTFTANMGGNLLVSEADAITLPSVVAAGFVDIASPGSITVGTVTSNSDYVRLSATGAASLIDDGDSGSVTRITGNEVFLRGNNIGATGGNAQIDTDTPTLNLDARGGNIVVRDVNNVSVAAFNANNGATLTRIESENGAVTLGTDVRPVSGSIELLSPNAGSAINYSGRTIGNQSNTGTVTVRTGNNLQLGSIFADNVVLRAGLAGGSGTITDAAGTTPSVTAASTLTLDGGTSVDLDIDAATLATNNLTGPLTIRDQVGNLTANNIAAGGAIDIRAVNGGLTANTVNAGSNALTLIAGTGALSASNTTSNGATFGSGTTMTLGTVNAGAGTASLTAGTTITNNANTLTAGTLSVLGGSTVTLNTNVNTINASGVTTALTVTEASGPLTLGTINIAGAVDIATSTGAITATSVTGNGVDLTAAGALTLGAVNAGVGGTATLDAGGAINDGAGATPSVVANQLTITAGASVNLDTDVNGLTATGINGPLTIREQNGPLTVTNAVSNGPLDISTVNGPLTVIAANSSNNALTLTAGTGALTLTAINAGAGTATLSAPGAITDQVGTTPSVTANQLTVLGAATLDLDTNINTLNASSVVGNLAIREQSGNLTVVRANGGGATSISTPGALLDDDAGTAQTTNISGVTSVTLSAGTGIGSVTDFATAAGSSVDVQTSGTLSANVTSSSGAINLNIAGGPTIAAGGITLGSGNGRTGTVVLQSGTALNLANLTAGAISIGDGQTASVGYVSGGLLTLSNGGSTTDFAPGNLLVSGADVVQDAGGGSTTRTIALTADQLNFIATAPAGAFTLNTTANSLNADVTTGAALNVVETNGLTVGRIVAQSFGLTAGGAITDDNDDATGITAQTVSLTSTGAIGATGGQAALDVNAGSLAASSGSGDVVVRSTSGSALTANLTAGSGAATAGNGNIVLTAAGDVVVAGLTAAADNVSLTTTGAVTNIGLVTAAQFTLGGASSATLGTDVDTLNASGVTGTLSVTEANGPLTIANAAAGGAVSVRNISGAIVAQNVTGNGVSLSAEGAGNALTVGTINAGAGTATLAAGGAIADAAGNAVSITAGTLAITGAASVDLDTNVNALNASGVTGTLAVREHSGALAVTNAAATGAVTVSTDNGSLTSVTASGAAVALTAGGANSDIALAQVTGTNGVTLVAGANGDVTGGTGTNVIGASLTLANVASVDLNTNVDSLNVSGIGGTLTIRETNAVNVTNATATGAISLTAGGAMTLGTVNSGTSNTLLSSTGAIVDAAGATPSVVANQLTITGAGSADLDTNVNTLAATGVTGALTIREQTGALTVSNASAGGPLSLSTVNGALDVTTATSGGALTLAAGGGALTLGTVNAGANAATLSATGAITDGTTGTGLTAGAATLSAASIGSAANTLNTAVTSLSATTSTGGMYFREANDVTLMNLNAAANQDIVVGAPGTVTVGTVNVSGANGSGRVLIAAGNDILATGGGINITAQSVELRSGGLVTGGGRIGAAGAPLRIEVPEFVPGGSATQVPSVLLLQNRSAADASTAAIPNQVEITSGAFKVSLAQFDPAQQTATTFLTTTFSTRTALGEDVRVENLDFLTSPLTGGSELAQINANSLSDVSDVSNAQGEGTLYIDWASFDPNVSLFGTVNPPICLPRDQQEDDSDAPADGAAGAAATSSACAATTAQREGSYDLPQLRLVITERGLEWVPVQVSRVTLPTLIASR